MPRMKLVLYILPFAITSIALSFVQSDLGSFEPVLRALSELPLVGGMAWILMRQQDKHQETIKTLMTHFADRSEKKDQFYQQLLKDSMETIEKLSTRTPS